MKVSKFSAKLSCRLVVPLIGIVAAALTLPGTSQVSSTKLAWSSYGHDAQHTAVSSYAAQNLNRIKWSTPVDLNPQYNGSDLFIHYGSPLVTNSNTVIVPVKTGATSGYKFEGRSGTNGSLKWTITSDYVLPPHDWTPSVSGALTAKNELFVQAAGGTLLYSANPDTSGGGADSRKCFFGLSTYNSNASTYNSTVFINTPITIDRYGSLYFGVHVTGSNPSNLVSSIVKLKYDGTSVIKPVTTAASDNSMSKVVHNCAPALSIDGSKLYIAVSNANGTNSGSGYLLCMNTADMSTSAKVRLKDPKTNSDAGLHDDGTASPTVGTDGDVYFGVLENPFLSNHDRGWLLHFNSTLTATKTPAAFGWDDTASVLPSSMVPGYTGSSTYLLMIKYNNYACCGGDGVNKVAVVDPKATQTDSITGVTVMKEIKTVAGQTTDSEFVGSLPHAVREWCINTAAVDPIGRCIIVNSEDGKCYKWSMVTGTLTQVITLAPATGEAYTPTVIGPDGTVYAINNARLFAIGN